MENFLDHPAIALFRKLIAVPSPSGYEAELAAIVRFEIEKTGFIPEQDAAGNVLVRLEGTDPHAPLTVIAAHMDEIGMSVKTINPDGSIIVESLGGLHPWKIGERPVTILGDNHSITAILSAGAGHGADSSKPVSWADFKLITGQSLQQLSEAGVRPGSPAVPVTSDRGPFFLGSGSDPLVAAWTYDDRMGVVALLRLLKDMKENNSKPVSPSIIAFTVQEELGGHGIKTLAVREKPQSIIAVDGCPMPSYAGLALDGRPGIWTRDRLAIYDPRLLAAFENSAKLCGTELQQASFTSTSSDSSMACSIGAAALCATFGHVRENSHGYEIARLSVFDNVLKVLINFVQTWRGV